MLLFAQNSFHHTAAFEATVPAEAALAAASVSGSGSWVFPCCRLSPIAVMIETVSPRFSHNDCKQNARVSILNSVQNLSGLLRILWRQMRITS